MKVEKIYECGKDTAKKIRGALKKAFPTVKFSVTSDHNSVYVLWTQGSVVPMVEEVVHRFKSFTTMRIGINDRNIATGYEWQGNLYVGAQYINCSRKMPPVIHKLITLQCKVMFEADPHGCFKVYERVEAELKLVEDDILQGYSIQS